MTDRSTPTSPDDRRAASWSSASRSTSSWPPRTKLFCGCPNEFGDEPNTNICPVCLGLPGSLPVLNAQAVELAMRLGAGAQLHGASRSIFARKNYFYPDMPKDYQISPVRPADQRRRLARAARRHARRHRAGPPRGGHRQVAPTSAAAAASTTPTTRSSTTTAPACRCVEIVSRPDIRTAEQATRLRRRAARHPARHRRVRRQDGGGLACGSTPTCRCARSATPSSAPAARSRTSTRCARSAGPSSTRPRRQVDLLEAGERVVAGDPPLGRGRRPHAHRCAPRRRRTTTATSPSPTWCRSTRRRSGSTAIDAALPVLPAARRAPPGRGRRRRARRAAVALARRARPRRPAPSPPSPPAATPARVLVHVEHNLRRRRRRRRSTRPHFAAARRRWRSTGS